MNCDIIKLVYHKEGRWVNTNSPKYVGGNQVIENLDIDLLSVTHMVKIYKEILLMPEVAKLYFVKPGKNLTNGLSILENDDGIRDIVDSVKNIDGDRCIHIYPYDDIVCKPPILDTQCSANIEHFLDVSLMDDEIFLKLMNTNSEGLVTENRIDEGLGTEKIIDEGLMIEERQMSENRAGCSDVESDLGSSYGNDMGSDSDSNSNASDREVELRSISQSSREVRFSGGDSENPHFLLGMTFAIAQEARIAIAKYSVAKCTPLKLHPNEKHRIRAKCKGVGCPFVLFMSKSGRDPGLVVKTFHSEHSCLKESKNKLASAKFLANEFKPLLREKPTITTKELMKTAEETYHLYVSKSTCKRAKKIVREELDSSYISEFGYLGAYIEMLKVTNPDTTAELEFREGWVFKRLYICFGALKSGWKAGCRPLIGLDGCHLKGNVKGQVLVAVGKDAENQMFPIAWAVTDKENKENWKWFLELLVKDLEINDRGFSITIISDMQKGLVNAVGEVLPLVEHRYCARHVHANWSKKWHSGELGKKFWVCVWSKFKEEFEDNLKLLGAISKQAAQDFMSYKPQVFCKAFLSPRCKSDVVTNNFCESLNASIRNARFKPIVSMLNEIRECAMHRLATHKKSVKNMKHNWSNSCMKVYEYNEDRAFGCKFSFNGKDGYEIGDRDNKHIVRVDVGMCTCRQWDITGIPCKHAIVALNHVQVDPKSGISFWYTKRAYMVTYEVAMQLVPDRKFMNESQFEPCKPPPTIRQPGRPRVKRIRSSRESRKGHASGSLGRHGRVMTCSICHLESHNSVTCPQKPKSKDQTQAGNKNAEKGKTKVGSTAFDNLNCKRKNRSMVGLGLYIDGKTGNSTFNPGMSSEIVINQRDPIANQPLICDPDPTTRYPIPNERELMEEHENSVSSKSLATRRIGFVAAGNEYVLPTNLPFKPPGLTWNDRPCTTRNALEKKQWEMKKKKK